MIVRGLGPAELAAMSDALRRGDPLRLELEGHVPRDVRLDEIAPLLYTGLARDPRDQRVLDAFAAPAARRGHPARVTAIIPCSRGVPRGVHALHRQDLHVRVLVLSNGPDGPEHVSGAEILRVPWEGHGRTRQSALRHVTDPYVFFTVDDAIPLGQGFLRTLVEALDAGPWAAVTARQIPWPDADRVTAERLRRWTPAGHRVIPFPQTDHVAALYRTETLSADPLPDVPIAEDAVWSLTHLVGYVPDAPILHAHTRQAGALYRRNRDIHAQLAAAGQAPAMSSIADVVAALPGIVRPSLHGQRGEWQNQIAELAGQWRGNRMGTRSRRKSEKGR